MGYVVPMCRTPPDDPAPVPDVPPHDASATAAARASGAAITYRKTRIWPSPQVAEAFGRAGQRPPRTARLAADNIQSMRIAQKHVNPVVQTLSALSRRCRAHAALV